MIIHEKLTEIQKKLKAPKNQFNEFGKYNYRSCEDILEALKPHLNGTGLHISDDVIQVGNRVYIKATATFTYADESISVSAFAREEETKKGMDTSQITGSASSYARKYALNGMFLIDDTKDSDTTNSESKNKPEPRKPQPKPQNQPPNPLEVSAPQKQILRDLMKKAGLTDEEQKQFYTWINPKTANDAKLFIESFDKQLTEWRKEQEAA